MWFIEAMPSRSMGRVAIGRLSRSSIRMAASSATPGGRSKSVPVMPRHLRPPVMWQRHRLRHPRRPPTMRLPQLRCHRSNTDLLDPAAPMIWSMAPREPVAKMGSKRTTFGLLTAVALVSMAQTPAGFAASEIAGQFAASSLPNPTINRVVICHGFACKFRR